MGSDHESQNSADRMSLDGMVHREGTTQFKTLDLSQYLRGFRLTRVCFSYYLVHMAVQTLIPGRLHPGGGASHLSDSSSYPPDTLEADLKVLDVNG